MEKATIRGHPDILCGDKSWGRGQFKSGWFAISNADHFICALTMDEAYFEELFIRDLFEFIDIMREVLLLSSFDE